MYIADAVGFVKGYLVSPETFFRNEKVSRKIVKRDLKYPEIHWISREIWYLSHNKTFPNFYKLPSKPEHLKKQVALRCKRSIKQVHRHYIYLINLC